jgi:O-antigen/teichoic acid export membrane protein
MNPLLALIQKMDPRTFRANRNVAVSLISKVVSIGVSFLVVPLTLTFITQEEYAVWIILSSTIAWFSFFDLGLGNGLRNKLSESLALQDIPQANIWVSSTFFAMSCIALILLIALSVSIEVLYCQSIFNVHSISERGLKIVLHVIVVLFCFDFLTKIFTNVLQAMQRHYLTDILSIVSQVLGLILIYALLHLTEGSLLKLCLVYAGKSPFVLGLASIIMFATSLKYLKPKWSAIQIKQAWPLLSLGFKFFLIQIFYLIVNQGSVMLITHFLGPKYVTEYSLALRYMTIPTMLFTMVLTPYITAFNEAFVKGENEWIIATMAKLRKLWMVMLAMIIGLVLIYPWFFHVWVGEEISISYSLIIALALQSIAVTWGIQYSLFLNGIGKVSLQLYVLLGQAVIFISFAILLFSMQMGTLSTVLAQVLVTVLSNLIMYIQYKKVISKQAKGIWGK